MWQSHIMATAYECDLLLVYSHDADTWAKFVESYLMKVEYDLKVQFKLDTDLMRLIESRSSPDAQPIAKTYIVIASPEHLEFLNMFQQFSYQDLIQTAARSQILLCGITGHNLAAMDECGQSLSDRFPDYVSWTKLSHENIARLMINAMKLIENVDMTLTASSLSSTPTSSPRSAVRGAGSNKRPVVETRSNGSSSTGSSCKGVRRRPKEFEMQPSTVKCSGQTTIFLLFKEAIADFPSKGKMEVWIGDKLGDFEQQKISAIWCNPYTYRFTAPARRDAGDVKIKVLQNSTDIGSKVLHYQSEEVPDAAVADLIQIYIHELCQLCELIIHSSHANSTPTCSPDATQSTKLSPTRSPEPAQLGKLSPTPSPEPAQSTKLSPTRSPETTQLTKLSPTRKCVTKNNNAAMYHATIVTETKDEHDKSLKERDQVQASSSFAEGLSCVDSPKLYASTLNDIDIHLSRIFDPDVTHNIPMPSFEMLFQIYRSHQDKESEFECPTLLHFASRYGLEELATKLIDLPDARIACAVKNTHGQQAFELADAHQHSPLASMLRDSMLVGELEKELDELNQLISNQLEHSIKMSCASATKKSSNRANCRNRDLKDEYMDMCGLKAACRSAGMDVPVLEREILADPEWEAEDAYDSIPAASYLSGIVVPAPSELQDEVDGICISNARKFVELENDDRQHHQTPVECEQFFNSWWRQNIKREKELMSQKMGQDSTSKASQSGDRDCNPESRRLCESRQSHSLDSILDSSTPSSTSLNKSLKSLHSTALLQSNESLQSTGSELSANVTSLFRLESMSSGSEDALQECDCPSSRADVVVSNEELPAHYKELVKLLKECTANERTIDETEILAKDLNMRYMRTGSFKQKKEQLAKLREQYNDVQKKKWWPFARKQQKQPKSVKTLLPIKVKAAPSVIPPATHATVSAIVPIKLSERVVYGGDSPSQSPTNETAVSSFTYAKKGGRNKSVRKSSSFNDPVTHYSSRVDRAATASNYATMKPINNTKTTINGSGQNSPLASAASGAYTGFSTTLKQQQLENPGTRMRTFSNPSETSPLAATSGRNADGHLSTSPGDAGIPNRQGKQPLRLQEVLASRVWLPPDARNSVTSASSRESQMSRSSFTSGVGMETVDEERRHEYDIIPAYRNNSTINPPADCQLEQKDKNYALNKNRKSRNIELLEIDLRTSSRPLPPLPTHSPHVMLSNNPSTPVSPTPTRIYSPATTSKRLEHSTGAISESRSVQVKDKAGACEPCIKVNDSALNQVHHHKKVVTKKSYENVTVLSDGDTQSEVKDLSPTSNVQQATIRIFPSSKMFKNVALLPEATLNPGVLSGHPDLKHVIPSRPTDSQDSYEDRIRHLAISSSSKSFEEEFLLHDKPRPSLENVFSVINTESVVTTRAPVDLQYQKNGHMSSGDVRCGTEGDMPASDEKSQKVLTEVCIPLQSSKDTHNCITSEERFVVSPLLPVDAKNNISDQHFASNSQPHSQTGSNSSFQLVTNIPQQTVTVKNQQTTQDSPQPEIMSRQHEALESQDPADVTNYKQKTSRNARSRQSANFGKRRSQTMTENINNENELQVGLSSPVEVQFCWHGTETHPVEPTFTVVEIPVNPPERDLEQDLPHHPSYSILPDLSFTHITASGSKSPKHQLRRPTVPRKSVSPRDQCPAESSLSSFLAPANDASDPECIPRDVANQSFDTPSRTQRPIDFKLIAELKKKNRLKSAGQAMFPELRSNNINDDVECQLSLLSNDVVQTSETDQESKYRTRNKSPEVSMRTRLSRSRRSIRSSTCSPSCGRKVRLPSSPRPAVPAKSGKNKRPAVDSDAREDFSQNQISPIDFPLDVTAVAVSPENNRAAAINLEIDTATGACCTATAAIATNEETIQSSVVAISDESVTQLETRKKAEQPIYTENESKYDGRAANYTSGATPRRRVKPPVPCKPSPQEY